MTESIITCILFSIFFLACFFKNLSHLFIKQYQIVNLTWECLPCQGFVPWSGTFLEEIQINSSVFLKCTDLFWVCSLAWNWRLSSWVKQTKIPSNFGYSSYEGWNGLKTWCCKAVPYSDPMAAATLQKPVLLSTYFILG